MNGAHDMIVMTDAMPMRERLLVVILGDCLVLEMMVRACPACGNTGSFRCRAMIYYLLFVDF